MYRNISDFLMRILDLAPCGIRTKIKAWYYMLSWHLGKPGDLECPPASPPPCGGPEDNVPWTNPPYQGNQAQFLLILEKWPCFPASPWVYSNKPTTSTCGNQGHLALLILQSPPPVSTGCSLCSQAQPPCGLCNVLCPPPQAPRLCD